MSLDIEDISNVNVQC